MGLDRVPILMYHRLGDVRPESIVPGHYVSATLFERQLRLLRLLRMNAVNLKTMQAGFRGEFPLPPRPVVVTFDDGYQSFTQLGMPTLKRFGMTATVFLVSDLIGSRNEWDFAIGDVEEPLMSREEVFKAIEDGFEFGAHTRRHIDLSKVSLEEAGEEIAGSKRDLESWIGRPVDYFCYPYGGMNEAVRRLVAQAGYLGATSTVRRGNGPDSDPFSWGRINVRSNTTTFRLLRRLLKVARS